MSDIELLQQVAEYVGETVERDFHHKRLDSLQNLQLATLLTNKNAYLYRAKNIATAEQIVRAILDAHLSSQEETIFGNYMESVAVFINETIYNGFKPPEGTLPGIDLIFMHGPILYIVSIKSGPNWGNSDQINRMCSNFTNAQKQLTEDYPAVEIIAVNGCMYGTTDSRPKKLHKTGVEFYKLCGQDFWRFVSGDDRMYKDIIEPLGYMAKQRNDEFNLEYTNIINKFTRQFLQEYMLESGAINWDAIVELSSQRRKRATYPLDLAV